jgi:hypothetical protein
MITMRQLVSGGFGLAVMCATSLTANRANALSCAANWLQAPMDGATDVPTNTRLWGYALRDGDGLRLVGPEGPVALEQRYIPVAQWANTGGHLSVLVPVRELEPNTEYTIELGRAGDFPRYEFVTGAGPAEQVLPPLALVSTEARAADGFGGITRYRELQFSHGSILIGDVDAALGPLASVADIEVTEPAVLAPPPSFASWATAGTHLAVGVGDCFVWPDADVERVRARFGAFDLAGNFSGWLDVPALDIPAPDELDDLLEESRAQAEADARARDQIIYAEGTHGDGHLTGCGLAKPSRQRSGLPLAGVALALGFATLARRRAVH